MRRDTQNLLLVLLGGALVKISVTDIFLRYVKPDHRWYLLAAGAAILVLASASLVRDARAARAGRSRDHGHGHREPHSPWLLLLPVLAIFLVAPPALGADSVERAGAQNAVVAAPDSGRFAPLPSGDAPELRLSDFVARAVWDGSHELADRDVTLTGFVVRRGGSVELARMVITCCAADARPMVVRLAGAGAVQGLEADGWLRVRARLVGGGAAVVDGYVPTVRVLDAVPIAAPAEAYEY
ncbi:TIGR03943 family putative permease subunit [Pseudonocardia acaciae]|uniref:TIGR03943 family putative permease subunit n=1 Tax=Pseudonocardia acaciae TaxID=551276 RepID=UPI0004901C2B|nr:TIGR03943 family protein [Pseudonocardia acaciae]